MAVNTSSSISTGTALHRFIENKAIEQFKLTSFLYGMGTHRTLKTGDHQYSMPVMNRTVFSAASAVLSEGVTPASTTVGFSQVTFDMVQYGVTATLTDLAVKDSPIELYTYAAKELGRQMAQIVDDIVQTELLTLDNSTQTQVIYGAKRATRAEITATDYASSKYFAEANAVLKSKGAPEIGAGYVAIAHPLVIQDLLTEVGSSTAGFFEASKYSQPENIFNGELGKMFGIRFVQSSNVKSFLGGVGGTVNLYPTFIVGEDAYGIVESQALETIIKPIGSAGASDPLNQRGTVSLKVRFGTKVLKPESNFRIETPVSLNPTLPY